MGSRKGKGNQMSIVEAVETLGAISDLDPEHLSVIYDEDQYLHSPTTKQVIQWMRESSPERRLEKVRSTFRVVLNYLLDFYNKQYRNLQEERVMDEIKTIMVFVGESARKLDKLSDKKSIKECEEFKKLQDFYKRRIAKEIDEGVLGEWILALTKRIGSFGKKRLIRAELPKDTTQTFVDLEGVKNDREYELFSIRKENGQSYYNPRLLRNMKLVSDFEGYFEYKSSEDPLFHVAEWKDHVACQFAKELMESCRKCISVFTENESEFESKILTKAVKNGLIALRMSANELNLMSRSPGKCCLEYFNDFLGFLRKALHSDEYKKLITYPSSQSNRGASSVVDLLHAMSSRLWMGSNTYSNLLPVIHEVLEKSYDGFSLDAWNSLGSNKLCWERLIGEYGSMRRLIKKHPSGSLNKILESLESGSTTCFNPLHQDNLPCQFFALQVQGHGVQFGRSFVPVEQSYIQKAPILEEYRAYLRRECQLNHLLFNFQNRTDWKDYARAESLEKLANQHEFKKNMTLITLTKDSEFYHQQGVYADENYIEVFVELFKKQLSDDHAGYKIPNDIRKALLPKFTPRAFNAIHKLFFSGKNVLSVKERQVFIELYYIILQLKLIHMTKPNDVSMICKDGIDSSCPSMVQLYVFMEFLKNGELEEKHYDQMVLMLYGPSLMIRERLIFYDRFNRMAQTIKRIEMIKNELGHKEFRKELLKEFAFLEEF